VEEKLTPARGLLLVRPVLTEETLPGSQIVLLDSTRAQMVAQQVEVVAVGEAAICSDLEECERHHHFFHEQCECTVWFLPCRASATQEAYHPCDVKPGDWVLVQPRSQAEVEALSELRLVRQDSVLGVFH
jgi:co-chaperonin GroES (HSP10)